MKKKRGLLLASGIIFVIIASLYAIIALAAIPNIDTIMPIIEAEINELVMIGEEELAERTLEAVELSLNYVLISVVLIAIVDMVLGVLLIRHSKEKDSVIMGKKRLVITAIVVSIFTSCLIVAILLIWEMNVLVEGSTHEQFAVSNINTKNVDQKQINEKYEIKIRRLQDLRDKGAITKEEYQKLLKQIFEE